MASIFVLPLIVVGIIIFMLFRLNNKINQLDYRLFRLNRLMEEVNRKLDKPLSDTPFVSPAENVHDVRSEVLEEEVPPVSQPVAEESMHTPPIQLTPTSFLFEGEEKKEVTPAKRRLNIEKIVGENLFSKIGILALIIGIGFFVKFAIDNNWINETYRTILGLVTGLGLWAIAYKLRDSYRGFSSVLAGGGFAICFVSIAIAYNFYKLIPSWLTFASLVTLTAFMILISVKFDRRQLAMVAIIGGYIAPFMSASDNGSAMMLFTYTAILNAAMLFVCIKKNWWVLSVPGCLITWLVVTISPHKADQGIGGLVFSTVFLIMFTLPMALIMWRDMKSSKLFYSLLATSIINMFAYIGLASGYIDHIIVMTHARGIVPLIVAVLNGWIYIRYYRIGSLRLMQNLLLGSVILFMVISVMMQFSNPSIMALFFAVFVMALLEIYGRTPKKIFAFSAVALALFTFIILNVEGCSNLDYPTMGCCSTMLVCGLCYFAYGVLISRHHTVYGNLLSNLYDHTVSVACYAATYIEGLAVYSLMAVLDTPEAGAQASAVMVMACLLFMSIYFNGNVINRLTIPGVGLLLFILLDCVPDIRNLTTEIFQWLSACIFICVLIVQVRSALTGNRAVVGDRRNNYISYYSIVGSIFLIVVTELLLRSVSLTAYYSAGFSVALIINGAVLLTLGMKYKCITVRFIGLGMFGLLLLKLVIYDLWLLPMIGRIVVFIFLGAVLLTLSFMYQRLRSKLFDKD